jgi:predicted metal-dependent peptidase
VSAGRDQSVLNELVVGADSSGSIGDDELGQILGSVRHAVEAIRFDIMHLLACDWRIREHYEIAANDLSNMPSTVKGGGGTRFEPVFNWQQHNAPDAPIIYLTDGHATDISYLREPDVPVLWLSWDKPVNQYPFGDAVRIWL